MVLAVDEKIEVEVNSLNLITIDILWTFMSGTTGCLFFVSADFKGTYALYQWLCNQQEQKVWYSSSDKPIVAVLAAIQLAMDTDFFEQSPSGQHGWRIDVPWLTLDQLEHFIPNRTRRSSETPRNIVATHTLSHGTSIWKLFHELVKETKHDVLPQNLKPKCGYVSKWGTLLGTRNVPLRLKRCASFWDIPTRKVN